MDRFVKRRRIEDGVAQLLCPPPSRTAQQQQPGCPVAHLRVTGRLPARAHHTVARKALGQLATLDRSLVEPIEGVHCHQHFTSRIVFDDVGRLLACAENTGALRIMDFKRYALRRGDPEVLTLETRQHITGLEWNPTNANEVITSYKKHGDVHVWDLEATEGNATSTLRGDRPPAGLCDVHFAPGRPAVVVAGGSPGVVLWDMRAAGRGPSHIIPLPSVAVTASMVPAGEGNVVVCGSSAGELLTVDLRRPGLSSLHHSPLLQRVPLLPVLTAALQRRGVAVAAALGGALCPHCRGAGSSSRTQKCWGREVERRSPCNACDRSGYLATGSQSCSVLGILPAATGPRRCIVHLLTGVTLEVDWQSGGPGPLWCPPPLRTDYVRRVSLAPHGPPVLAVPREDTIELLDWSPDGKCTLPGSGDHHVAQRCGVPQPPVCAAFHPGTDAVAVGTLGAGVHVAAWQPFHGICPYPVP